MPNWDDVYSKNYMTMWYPNEDIIRFCARLIQKQLTHDKFDVKRAVERVLDLAAAMAVTRSISRARGSKRLVLMFRSRPSSGRKTGPDAKVWISISESAT